MKPYGYVYLITNLITGRFYIGQTRRTVAYRWSVHKSEAKLRPGCYLHKSIRKYGFAAFEVQTVATARDRDELMRLERAWILATGSARREIGYNLTFGGDGNIRTAETTEKITAAKRGHPLTAEHKAKLSKAFKGRKQSPEWIAKRFQNMRGRTPSLACREAVAAANRRRVFTSEQRQRCSENAQKANLVRWGHR